jgi:hypothetical protein
MVAIFYACIRELRSNIIGKTILMLAISGAITLIGGDIEHNAVAIYLPEFLSNLEPLLFLVMVYETFVLLKY